MIDLALFCDDEGWLSKPWKSGESVFATNGRICCQVSAADYDAEPWAGERKAPSIDEVLTEPDTWTPFEFTPADCDQCKGKCEYSGRCDQCGGYREHECECGHKHTCGCCNGTSRQQSLCEHNRRLLGTLFDDRYLLRMAASGVTEIGLIGERCLQFRGPGFRGALMGLKEADGPA